MKKKVSVLFTALVLMVSFMSAELLAKENNAKESLVALGDSIPFGYNLENNKHVSKEAFPALIGEKAGLRVHNLGNPGWTTTELLHALENDEKFRQAVRHADYVTLSIGSNDLLQSFAANPSLVTALAMDQTTATEQEILTYLDIPALTENLTKIVYLVNELSDAEIVVYNIYNPFFSFDPRYGVGMALLPAINGAITQTVTSFENVTVADAFSGFNSGTNSDSYLISGDIHPTVSGHEVLAEIGYNAISN